MSLKTTNIILYYNKKTLKNGLKKKTNSKIFANQINP